MRFPPKLSKRETEILPYLVGGLTRREIAEKMAISEETVKIFTRKVARKFGGATLRDPMKDVTEYNKFFVEGHHKFYVPHVDFSVQLLSGRINCQTTARFDIIPISQPVETYVEAYTTLSDMKYIKVNGEEVNAIADVESKHMVNYVFDQPIQCFDVREVVVETAHRVSETLDAVQSYGNSAYDPTGSMTVTVAFQPDDIPRKITTHRRYASHVYRGEFKHHMVEHGVYQFTIQDPIFMSSYALEWEW